MNDDTHADNEDYYEVTPETKSFAFLKAQAEITKLSCALTLISKCFDFSFDRQSEFLDFAADDFLEHFGINITDDRDYIISTFQDFYSPDACYPILYEAILTRVVDTFIEYIKDIISICALSDPDAFDIKHEFSVGEILNLRDKEEIVLVMVSRRIEEISNYNIPRLNRLLGKIGLIDEAISKPVEIVKLAIEERNKISHALGIRQWAINNSKREEIPSRRRVSHEEFMSYYDNIITMISHVDDLARSKYDVWKGTDHIAPGLYRKPVS